MAKIKITKRTVEALKVAAKDYIAFDTDLPGFGVRVMPSAFKNAPSRMLQKTLNCAIDHMCT